MSFIYKTTNITSKRYRKYKEKIKFVTIILNSKMKVIVDSLEIKIKKLISLHDNMKQERELAVDETEKIKKELIEKREVIKKLEEKIKINKHVKNCFFFKRR